MISRKVLTLRVGFRPNPCAGALTSGKNSDISRRDPVAWLTSRVDGHVPAGDLRQLREPIGGKSRRPVAGRGQIAEFMRCDVNLARARIAELNEYRGPANVSAAVDTVAAFAGWCQRAAEELESKDLIDMSAVISQWRTQAAHAGIRGHTVYLDAVPMFTSIGALVALWVGGPILGGFFAVVLTTGARAADALARLTPTTLLVGPDAPNRVGLWGLR